PVGGAQLVQGPAGGFGSLGRAEHHAPASGREVAGHRGVGCHGIAGDPTVVTSSTKPSRLDEPMNLPRVDPPRPATSVLVDLRNSTPNLNAAGHDPDGTNQFCHFLAQFYSDTLDACRLALAPAERGDPPLAVNSTGDGMLVVFFGPRHFANGLLAGFLLEV